MPEKKVNEDDFFEFVKVVRGDFCAVKFCRNERMSDRKLCSKHNMQLWRARNPTRNAYNNVRGKAKQRKVEFTLTFEEFCSIDEATGYVSAKGQDMDSLTLDRIDPNQGYSFENIRVITLSENSRKGCYEKWVTTKDGRRVRIYQVGLGSDHHEEAGAYKESLPDNVEEVIDPDCTFIPTENEPF